MAKKGNIPTTQYINDLAEKASAGDLAALSELGDLNNRIAKRANERMRDIERKGLEGTAAYNRAKYFIQEQDFGTDKRKYFTQSRKLDIDDAVLNITNASNYLRSQTSTAAGEMSRRATIIDRLKEGGWIEVPDEDPATFKRKFLEFLDSNAWDDIKKHMYATNSGMLKEAGEAIQNGASLRDLMQAHKDYQKGSDTDLFEIWDNWTSGQMYYKSGDWHALKRPRK